MIGALRPGLARGGIEVRQAFSNPTDLWGYLFPAFLLVGTIFFMRDAAVPGTSFSLGASTLPSAIGMGIAFGGLVSVAQLLVVEREDGTLLRAKAIPDGMTGYLIGKIVVVGGMTLAGLVIQLAPSRFHAGVAAGRGAAVPDLLARVGHAVGVPARRAGLGRAG